MQIDQLDHLVLTVQNVTATCAWHERVLGMQIVRPGEARTALPCGTQMISLYETAYEFEPKTRQPAPGCADLCFVTRTPIAEVVAHLTVVAVPIELGPVRRTGARRSLESVYVRDPDQNLIEIAHELDND